MDIFSYFDSKNPLKILQDEAAAYFANNVVGGETSKDDTLLDMFHLGVAYFTGESYVVFESDTYLIGYENNSNRWVKRVRTPTKVCADGTGVLIRLDDHQIGA